MGRAEAPVYPRQCAPFQAALSTARVVVAYVVFGFVWFWWTPLHSSFLAVNALAVMTSYLIPWTYAIWSRWRGRHDKQLQAEIPSI